MKKPHEPDLWPLTAAAVLRFVGLPETIEVERCVAEALQLWKRRARREDHIAIDSTELFYEALRVCAAAAPQTTALADATAVLEQARILLQEPFDEIWSDIRSQEFLQLPAYPTMADAAAAGLRSKYNPAREFRDSSIRPSGRVELLPLYRRTDIHHVSEIRTPRQWLIEGAQVLPTAAPLFELPARRDATSRFFGVAATEPLEPGPYPKSPAALASALLRLRAERRALRVEASDVHYRHKESKRLPGELSRGFVMELTALMHDDAGACMDLHLDALDCAHTLGWATSVKIDVDPLGREFEVLRLAGHHFRRPTTPNVLPRPRPGGRVSDGPKETCRTLSSALRLLRTFVATEQSCDPLRTTSPAAEQEVDVAGRAPGLRPQAPPRLDGPRVRLVSPIAARTGSSSSAGG